MSLKLAPRKRHQASVVAQSSATSFSPQQVRSKLSGVACPFQPQSLQQSNNMTSNPLQSGCRSLKVRDWRVWTVPCGLDTHQWLQNLLDHQSPGLSILQREALKMKNTNQDCEEVEELCSALTLGYQYPVAARVSMLLHSRCSGIPCIKKCCFHLAPMEQLVHHNDSDRSLTSTECVLARPGRGQLEVA